MDEIVSVLHNLKEEVNRKSGFNDLPIFQVGNLRTTDPAEIDPVITLQSATELLDTTKPTATKAIGALCQAGILEEIRPSYVKVKGQWKP